MPKNTGRIMEEVESKPSVATQVPDSANYWVTGLRNNKILFPMIVLAALVASIPFYGMLFPPQADLAQHLLVNKLLWEKLAGVSQLDLGMSWFLGYRLLSVVIVVLISFCKLLGISLVYLPKITLTALISFHALVVVAALYFGLRDRTWRSASFAFCFSIPAVVAMFSACFLIGFVGFTLGITLLIPAVFLTERYLRSGKAVDALFVFISLLLIYTAHPFTTSFWLMWCFSRMIAALATRTFFSEWKRLITLGLIFLPIFLYHFLATSGTELAPSSNSLFSQSPFVTADEWYRVRLGSFLDGSAIKVDEISDSKGYGYFAIVFMLSAALLAFLGRSSKRVKTLMLSSLLFLFVASWVNEKFIPVTPGFWLAYDYRFVSTVYVICLAVAGVVLIRLLPVSTDNLLYRAVFVVLALLSILAPVSHLLEVRKAYARFDAPAREYMDKTFSHEFTTGIAMPRARWYSDTNFLRHYVCLQQPDCNPAGTMFVTLAGDLYPVKLRSANRIMPADAPAVDMAIEPISAFNGGEGYGRGQFSKPRGIATDTTGSIYVTDTGNARVQKFDADGNFVLAFGKYGEGEGRLKSPNGIAVDSAGNIYVVDSIGNKLLRFGQDGTFQKEWLGPAEKTLIGPRDVAIGPDNQLYILDQGRGRVVRFDPGSEAFSEFGSPGSGVGQFIEPTGISASGGYVFVADRGNNRIQSFDPDGKFIRQWAAPAFEKYVWNYADVEYDPDSKRLYATNGWKREVLVFDIEGRPLDPIKLTPGAGFENISSVVLSKTNNMKRLLVVNTGSDYADNCGDPNVAIIELAN